MHLFCIGYFPFNWLQMACDCYNAKHLHEKIKLNSAWRMNALINPTAYPRCSV